VHGLLSDHRESFRIVKVQTDPSGFEVTLLATWGTAWKSAVNFMSPAQSEATPLQ
jgi:hypothetical protein